MKGNIQMKDITLVILAAGIGSRFGKKIKQLEPIGPNGELLRLFDLDAIQAGFNKVVFIIRKDIEELFKEKIGDRIAQKVAVEYVYQAKEDIPVRGELVSTRVKPWGTGQAILCCKDAVKEPFVVINADDYYGTDSYKIIYDYLVNADNSGKTTLDYCLTGFKLKNTLSDNGAVTRGICKVDGKYLVGLEETKGIIRNADNSVTGKYNGAEVTLDENANVSMNLWGFTPEIFAELDRQFIEFLNGADIENNTDEFIIPIAVDEMIKGNRAKIELLTTDSHGSA